jgi:hypothetical protein
MGNTSSLFKLTSSQSMSPESTCSDGDGRYHKRGYEELAELLTHAKKVLAEAEEEFNLGLGKSLGSVHEREVERAIEVVEIARENLRVVTGEVEMVLSEWEKRA